MENKRPSQNIPISFGIPNNVQSTKDNKISQIDISILSKQDSSIYNSSEYNYASSMDGIKGDYQNNDNQKMDQINENPKAVKFVSGLKEDSIELKLSSLYCVGTTFTQIKVKYFRLQYITLSISSSINFININIKDKDMIQMPVIDLPQNQYGLEEFQTFSKENVRFNQLKVWKNITKDVLNPFVPTLRRLVYQQTELEKGNQKNINQYHFLLTIQQNVDWIFFNIHNKIIGNNQMKFKQIQQRKGIKEKFEKMKDTITMQTANPPKSQHRESKSLDHFFQYFIQEDQKENNAYLQVNYQHQSKRSKLNILNVDCQPKSKKSSLMSINYSSKKQIRNSQQTSNFSKSPAGMSPYIQQDEDNNGKHQRFLKQQEYQRANNSNRSSANMIPTSPINSKNARQQEYQKSNISNRSSTNLIPLSPQNSKNTPSTFGQALQGQIIGSGNNGTTTQNTAQIRIENKDFFEILDRKYRKKYNMEYKMQLRRKSCYCTQCGESTRYENKYQNIVNPILIRRKKRLNKVFKAVNFINKMGRTMRQIPSQIEIDNNESQSAIKYPSLENQIDSQGEIRFSLKNTPQTRPIKIDPPSLMLIEKRNTLEENDLKISLKNINQPIKESQINQSQQPNKSTNRIRKSFTLHVVEDVKSQLKNDIKRNHYDGYQSFHDEDDDDEEELDIYERQQQSFVIEINNEEDLSAASRHQVADIRSKGKKQSYIQEKSSFLNFIDKKIKEAKKKRLEEETKYVGKTPLTVLMQILSQGKRNSVFNSTQEQEKKIQKFIFKSRKSHQNISQNNKQYNQSINQKIYNERQQSNNRLNSAHVLSDIGTQQNFNRNQIQQTSSSQLSNKNVQGDENALHFEDKFHSEREKLNSGASQYNNSPLVNLKRKYSKLQQSKTQRERGFYISPVQQRTFDQMSSQQSNRSTGFNAPKKSFILDGAVNPIQIIKSKIKQQKEIEPYLKQEVSQKQELKKMMTLRDYKLNTPCSSQRNRQITSHSTQRQTNTAQTTDRSSMLSSSNKKLNDHKENNIRENQMFIKNEFSTSRNNQNATDRHQSRDKIVNSLILGNNSFSQNQLQNGTSKLISPRFKQLLDDPQLMNKGTPYIKQMFPHNKISKSPEYKASQTQTQLAQSKSFRFFKSTQTNYQ